MTESTCIIYYLSCCIDMTAVSDACTRGFMHLDLLTERVTKLEASESTNKLDAQLYIVPDVSFNCDNKCFLRSYNKCGINF